MNGRERWANEAMTNALWRADLIKQLNANLTASDETAMPPGHFGRLIGNAEERIIRAANSIIHASTP